jgi:hypothetical protein
VKGKSNYLNEQTENWAKAHITKEFMGKKEK